MALHGHQKLVFAIRLEAEAAVKEWASIRSRVTSSEELKRIRRRASEILTAS